MPTQMEIYAHHAAQYEALVAREDYQGNLPKILREIASTDGLDMVELGAGTGRLTRMLAPAANTVYAFDASAHMLGVAREKLAAEGLHNWQTAVADHRHIPVQDHCADLVISGWSFCYLVVNNPENWQTELDKGLAEIMRVTRPGGTLLIIETLGTGHEQPYVHGNMKDYFETLEQKGFQTTWIRTDYHFTSLQEAITLTGFFFGCEMATRVQEQQWVILPECTGLWYLTTPDH